MSSDSLTTPKALEPIKLQIRLAEPAGADLFACWLAGVCGLARTACFLMVPSATGEGIFWFIAGSQLRELSASALFRCPKILSVLSSCLCCNTALHCFLAWVAPAGARWLSVQPMVTCRWYKLLDRFVMPNNSRSTAAVLLKTAADQVVWAPIMTVVFFAVLKSLEGHPELIWPTVQVCPPSLPESPPASFL